MATIYFNQPILKHISDITILNFFMEDSGKSVLVRDTRQDIYSGVYKAHADIKFYEKNGDYFIDLEDMSTYDGQMYGVFIGEGFDFEIRTDADPIFVVKQDKTDTSLASLPWLQNKSVLQMMLGMFTMGTTISFKVEGQPIVETLTKLGWVRTNGPKDKDLGIITIDEAFENKKELEASLEHAGITDAELDLIARLEDAIKRKLVPRALAESRIRLIRSREVEDAIFMYLTTEVELLKQHNLLH